MLFAFYTWYVSVDDRVHRCMQWGNGSGSGGGAAARARHACTNSIIPFMYRTDRVAYWISARRSTSPIRRTLKRCCVCLRLIVLIGIWAAAIVSQLASLCFLVFLRNRKLLIFCNSPRCLAVVKLCVGAVHNARGPVWSWCRVPRGGRWCLRCTGAAAPSGA